jgi:hypothetical protein
MLPLGNGLGQQGQQRQQQRDGATRLAVAEAAGSPVCQLAEDVKDTQALGRDTPTVPQVPVDEITRDEAYGVVPLVRVSDLPHIR